MSSAVLSIHSWLRWVTLVLAIAATINALRPPRTDGTLPGKSWDTFFMMAVDLQVLFGLVLYFGLSPFTKRAMVDLGETMKPWNDTRPADLLDHTGFYTFDAA